MTTEQILYSLEKSYLTPIDCIEEETTDYNADIQSRLHDLEEMIIEAEENGDATLVEELEEQYQELEGLLN